MFRKTRRLEVTKENAEELSRQFIVDALSRRGWVRLPEVWAALGRPRQFNLQFCTAVNELIRSRQARIGGYYRGSLTLYRPDGRESHP